MQQSQVPQQYAQAGGKWLAILKVFQECIEVNHTPADQQHNISTDDMPVQAAMALSRQQHNVVQMPHSLVATLLMRCALIW